ncbi:Type I phosphodiesterase / nucleotide pyrophosphatase family protein [Ascosphaera apis ARSEF 7405]|uniref:Type I phosphodiesterase / nucleotide pyrophosphatase family protein n=1 Tax=Ascosphaera apis ARSEF 7405 TaxID=392613 RepID=A0A162IHZ5_9EURO|nr:Type I phosphodiesterase / nucleotide pyrophosphatase family protein [Ascosphaera apis ARSEF 7405]
MAGAQDPTVRSSSTYLSPYRRDDDNISLRSLSGSVSDIETDSEDDEILTEVRDSRELARYDHTVLDEADDIDQLLVKKDEHGDPLRRIFSRSNNKSRVRVGRIRRKSRQRGRGADGEGRSRATSRATSRDTRLGRDTDSFGDDNIHSGERGQLLHDVEAGVADNDDGQSDVSSIGSDDAELEKLVTAGGPRRRSWRFASLYISGAVVLFCIIFLGAYKQSSKLKSTMSSHVSSEHGPNHPNKQRTLFNNGTSLFAPTTIFISLDGFRADFLQLGLTPTLSSIIKQGISPPYMMPSFPSVTFPNHFTLMTGLYPESHGVVGNTFYDPHLDDDFYYTNPAKSTQSKWWTAEPLWSVAESQGVRSAVHMWPGSEANIGKVSPTVVDGYNKSVLLQKKAERILDLLDLPGDHDDDADETNRRPAFIAAYVPNVDADGHRYGPNTTQVRETIVKVDNMLETLMIGLDERNLTDIVNLVIVSDHGMATTSNKRLVQLEDLIDLSLVERLDGWPHRGLRPKAPVEENLKTLEKQLAESYPRFKDKIEVYNKSTMPERYHFTQNDRIAPLWVFPKTGYAVVERPWYDVADMVKLDMEYDPKGIHGYDHEHPLMRAIFIARGPKFGGIWPSDDAAEHKNNATNVKFGGRKMEPFQNIQVYNLIADSLEVDPHPNNGTLRLPLKVTGQHEIHDAKNISKVEHKPLPSKPIDSTMTTLPSLTHTPDPSITSTTGQSIASTSISKSISATSTTNTQYPTQSGTSNEHDNAQSTEGDGERPDDDRGFFGSLWHGFLEKVDGARHWAEHVFDKDSGNK